MRNHDLETRFLQPPLALLRTRPNREIRTPRCSRVVNPVNHRNLASRPEQSKRFAKQIARIFRMQDVEEHGVVS